MTKKEQIRKNILTQLRICRILSTDQAALYLDGIGSPRKRASETLQELCEEKLIEGKRIRIDRPKIWRLTKKGRDQEGQATPPIPFTTPKLDHFLALGDVYQWLLFHGSLQHYEIELREPFGLKKYCADAFFIWNGRARLLELQLTPLSSKRWAMKWQIANDYFKEAFKTASFQRFGKLKPQIVVLSKQRPDTILFGSHVSIRIIQNIQEMAAMH